tara:strand:+ start:8798 stop:8971 length:174 start_codon:yes stop_codon:yes gene_type:complete
MTNKLKDIDRTSIKFLIDAGASSRDAALSLGVSKTTVLKKAKEAGLKFDNKSPWRKL